MYRFFGGSFGFFGWLGVGLWVDCWVLEKVRFCWVSVVQCLIFMWGGKCEINLLVFFSSNKYFYHILPNLNFFIYIFRRIKFDLKYIKKFGLKIYILCMQIMKIKKNIFFVIAFI